MSRNPIIIDAVYTFSPLSERLVIGLDPAYASPKANASNSIPMINSD